MIHDGSVAKSHGNQARGKGHEARGKTFFLVAPSFWPSQKRSEAIQTTDYFAGFCPISWKVFLSIAEVFGVSKNDRKMSCTTVLWAAWSA